MSPEENKEFIGKQLRGAFDRITGKIDYDKLAAFTGKDAEELRRTLKEMLGDFLNRFPNILRSAGNGWTIARRRMGPGTHEIEVIYPAAIGSDLIFDYLRVQAAADAGLIDELGNPVWPAPACPECLRQNEAFDFLGHLARQRAFSENTFGPGQRTKGVCDHIRKELAEIESQPHDLEEWIDVVILALDGAWRCGGTPEQILATLQAKQAKNESRQWPDWKTADPNKAITHVKAAGEGDA